MSATRRKARNEMIFLVLKGPVINEAIGERDNEGNVTEGER